MQAYDKWPFQGELSNSWFFWCDLSSSILNICIRFVHMRLGGLLGAGKVHLKCCIKKLIKDNFASLRQIRFNMFMWCQASWFGRSTKAFLTRSRADPRNSVQRSLIACQMPSTRNLSSVFSLGKEASWVFPAKLMIYLCKKFVPAVVIQHLGILKNARDCNHSQRFSTAQLCAAVFILKIKWNISLWAKQHDLAKQHDVAFTHAVHHLRELTSAITSASPWTTAGKKTLPNLQSIAPKED